RSGATRCSVVAPRPLETTERPPAPAAARAPAPRPTSPPKASIPRRIAFLLEGVSIGSGLLPGWGRGAVGVVDAAHDDRLVGVALEEVNDDLLADPWHGDEPGFLPGVQGADADPARAVRVVLPLAVPEELHLHAPVLVGEDLRAGRPHDHRGLRPLDERPRRRPDGTERQPDRDGLERVVVVDGALRGAPWIAMDRPAVGAAQEVVLPVPGEVARQAERQPTGELSAGRRALHQDGLRGLRAHPHRRGRRPLRLDQPKLARVVAPAGVDPVEPLRI